MSTPLDADESRSDLDKSNDELRPENANDDCESLLESESPAVSSNPASPPPEAFALPLTVASASDLPITSRSLVNQSSTGNDALDVSVEQHPIRAVIRVRPFSCKDPLPWRLAIQRPSGEGHTHDNSIIIQKRLVSELDTKSVRFRFDAVIWPKDELTSVDRVQAVNSPTALPRVFRSDGMQEVVYREVGAPAVHNALRGCNVCILAYGQTGSGKSHSLFGPTSDRGVASRAAIDLFAELASRRERGVYSSVDLQMFEIYNETVSDLLAKRHEVNSSSLHRRTWSTNTADSSDAAAGASSPWALDSQVLGDPVSSPASAASPTHVVGSEAAPSPIGRGLTMKAHEIRPSASCDDTMSLAAETGNLSHRGSFWQTSATLSRRSRSGSLHDISLRTLTKNEAVPAAGAAQQQQQQQQQQRRDVVSSTQHSVHNGFRPSSAGTADDERASASPKLRVRFHPDCGAFVDGARCDIVNSGDELITAIEEAMSHRVTAATLMNDTSSRSHAVIQITIRQEDRIYGKRTTSLLNFVDLAGSERVGRSGVAGAQFNEARNINLSLTTLRRVIDILIENAERKKHAAPHVPPYRESMLTFLLADSFGGNSRTTLLATVSPHASNINDTVSTLRYAQKAQKIVCKVHVNQSRSKVVVTAIQAELDKLAGQLEQEQAVHLTVVKNARTSIARKENIMTLMERLSEKKRNTVFETLEPRVVELRQEHGIATRRASLLMQAKEEAEFLETEAKALLEEVEQHRSQIEATATEIATIDEEHTQLLAEMNTTIVVNGQEVTRLQHWKACQRRAWRRAFIAAAAEQRRNETLRRCREENKELRERLSACSARREELLKGIDDHGFQLSVVRKLIQREEDRYRAIGDQFQQHHMAVRNARAEVAYSTSECDKVSREIEAVEAEILRVKQGEDEGRVAALHNALRSVLTRSFSEAEHLALLRDEDCASVLAQLAAIEAAEQLLCDEAPKLEQEFLRLRQSSSEALTRIRQATADVEAGREALMTDLISVSAAEQAVEEMEAQLKAAEAYLKKQLHIWDDVELSAREKLFPDAPPAVSTAPLSALTLRAVRAPNTVDRSGSRARSIASATSRSRSRSRMPSSSPHKVARGMSL